MCDFIVLSDARVALSEARESWEKIATALLEAAAKAEEVQDRELMGRLGGLADAVERGRSLVNSLEDMLQASDGPAPGSGANRDSTK